MILLLSVISFTQSYLELAKIHEKIEDFSKAIYYYKIVDNKNKSSTYSFIDYQDVMRKFMITILL